MGCTLLSRNKITPEWPCIFIVISVISREITLGQVNEKSRLHHLNHGHRSDKKHLRETIKYSRALYACSTHSSRQDTSFNNYSLKSPRLRRIIAGAKQLEFSEFHRSKFLGSAGSRRMENVESYSPTPASHLAHPATKPLGTGLFSWLRRQTLRHC